MTFEITLLTLRPDNAHEVAAKFEKLLKNNDFVYTFAHYSEPVSVVYHLAPLDPISVNESGLILIMFDDGSALYVIPGSIIVFYYDKATIDGPKESDPIEELVLKNKEVLS